MFPVMAVFLYCSFTMLLSHRAVFSPPLFRCHVSSVSVAFSLNLASPSCKLLHFSVTLSQERVDDNLRSVPLEFTTFYSPSLTKEYMENTVNGHKVSNCFSEALRNCTLPCLSYSRWSCHHE